MFELRQLRHFEAVYRLRSFTRASEEQHLTQSALSRSLKGLETELGQQLFDRSTHSVTPTGAADELIAHAIDALAAVESMTETATVLGEGAKGTVRIGAGPYPVQPLLTGALRSLSETNPEIQVLVTVGRPADLVAAMVRREVDAVIADASKFESVERARVVATVLKPEPLVVVMGSEHPLSESVPTARDLATYPWALPTMSPWSIRNLPSAFASLGTSGFPRYQLESTTACLDVVSDQRTVTMVPLSLARAECPMRGLVFGLAQPPMFTRDAIHVLKGHTQSKTTLIVLEEIARQARRLARDADSWSTARRDH